MATHQDGGVRRATANTVAAMKRGAEARKCPACKRKSAMVHFSDLVTIGAECRWCGWWRVYDRETRAWSYRDHEGRRL